MGISIRWAFWFCPKKKKGESKCPLNEPEEARASFPRLFLLFYCTFSLSLSLFLLSLSHVLLLSLVRACSLPLALGCSLSLSLSLSHVRSPTRTHKKTARAKLLGQVCVGRVYTYRNIYIHTYICTYTHPRTHNKTARAKLLGQVCVGEYIDIWSIFAWVNI